MNILVLNCGSSTVKAEIINIHTGERLIAATAERIISEQPQIRFSNDPATHFCDKPGHEAALTFLLDKIKSSYGDQISGIGHRVVHGGDQFDQAATITMEVEQLITDLAHLAPLHNPVNLKGIQLAKIAFPKLPHIAVFDTAFHQTLPKRAKTYAIPSALNEKYNIRRYGFHGTSHDYVANEAADYLQMPLDQLRVITCHLGNGCSVAAVEYGRSVETSMGMTPLEGLIMGTRSGDIDPGVLIYLAKKEKWSIEKLDNILNKESGLKGLSNNGNDMRDIIDKASNGDEDAQLALQVFCHRVRKYVGAYAAVMGGVDAIVFTGGIGENSSVVRHRVAQRLDFLGAIINEDKNHSVRLSKEQSTSDFAMNHSRVKLLAIKTDEQFAIARQSARIIMERNKVNQIPAIPIAVSARHMHVTQETLELLYGPGYTLTERNPLSQPNQFAANETVTVIGPKNQIERVRILGPVRSKNQIEISRTDEFFLGIDAPIRQSGKVENTPGCRVVGPFGSVDLEDGVICAWRHIHMTPEDAILFGVEDKDIVDVKITSGDRPMTFGNVLIRVSPKYKLEMHIDTDEGNAAELSKNAEGALISTSGTATLEKRKVKHGSIT